MDDEEAALESVRRGAQDYIVKGKWDGYILSRSLQYAIERHSLVRQLDLERKRLQSQIKWLPIPAYTWEWSGDEFILVSKNLVAEIHFNNSDVELGMKAGEIFHKLPELQHGLHACRESGSTIINQKMHHIFSGEEKYLVITYVYTPENFVTMYIEDVTEQKIVEYELKMKVMELEELVAGRNRPILTKASHHVSGGPRAGETPRSLVRAYQEKCEKLAEINQCGIVVIEPDLTISIINSNFRKCCGQGIEHIPDAPSLSNLLRFSSRPLQIFPSEAVLSTQVGQRQVNVKYLQLSSGALIVYFEIQSSS